MLQKSEFGFQKLPTFADQILTMETANTFNGKRVYTLTEVANSLQSMIEKTYKHAYYIKAEIIKLNQYPRTGHCYPELVEKEGSVVKTQMRAVIWAAQYNDINTRFRAITGEPLKDGISILCLATIEYSPKYGLALYIQDIEPSYTLGEMARNRAETIKRLKDEKVFDANKKLKMPLLPQRLAIISVETSKGYSDFMLALEKHKYRFDTQLFPSLLQGEKAVITIMQQLERIAQQKEQFDCVLIIRGGGGDVGLNCYDQFELAHKVATFPLPVISGIGHSTNETITEMVSYANKISPTEVAYFLIGLFENFENSLSEIQQLIQSRSLAILKDERHYIAQIESNFKYISNGFLLRERQSLDTYHSQLQHFTKLLLEKQKNNLHNWQTQIQLLHPSNLLKRGFSITYYNGKPVTAATQLKQGDKVETQFYEGKVEMEVTDKSGNL